MMLIPSEDGFLTRLQETGFATATFTASDDLVIVIGTIQDRVKAALGCNIRVYLKTTDSLHVRVRSD